MLLKTKPTYYTKYRDQELNNFILDVYDDFRLLEPTLVTELPAPVKEYRGKFVLKQGDPDELYVCVETGSGYAWMKVWYSGEEGSGSGLDADKVDGYDASTTPQANTIPVANGDGSIKDWITDQEILDKLKNVDGSGSGLDADLLRGLPADFTCSKNQNGYTKLPNGLILQWGREVQTTDSNGYVTYTFPISFPNMCFSISCVDTGAVCVNYGVTQLTTTGFTVFCRDSNGTIRANASTGVYFIAIGF